jgi:hypothetical protein
MFPATAHKQTPTNAPQVKLVMEKYQDAHRSQPNPHEMIQHPGHRGLQQDVVAGTHVR